MSNCFSSWQEKGIGQLWIDSFIPVQKLIQRTPSEENSTLKMIFHAFSTTKRKSPVLFQWAKPLCPYESRLKYYSTLQKKLSASLKESLRNLFLRLYPLIPCEEFSNIPTNLWWPCPLMMERLTIDDGILKYLIFCVYVCVYFSFSMLGWPPTPLLPKIFFISYICCCFLLT